MQVRSQLPDEPDRFARLRELNARAKQVRGARSRDRHDVGRPRPRAAGAEQLEGEPEDLDDSPANQRAQ